MATEPAQRRSRTPARVYLADRLARVLITAGGWGVIVAVLGICLYLLVVTVPLFERARPTESRELPIRLAADERLLEVDEYASVATVLSDLGRVRFLAIEDGRELEAQDLGAGDVGVGVVSRAVGADLLGVGLSDGSVRLGSVTVEAVVRTSDGLEGAPGSVVQPIDGRSVRVLTPRIELGEPAPLAEGQGPVVALDYRRDAAGRRFLLALRSDGTLVLGTVRVVRPLGGGVPRTTLASTASRVEAPSEGDQPRAVLVMNDGADALVVWAGGLVQRFAVDRGGRSMALAESFDLGEGVREAALLLGSRTLVVGDVRGRVRGYTVAADPLAPTLDGRRLVRSRTLSAAGPVDGLAISARDRVLAAVSGERARLLQGTSGKTLADIDLGASGASVVVSPRNTALISAMPGGAARAWSLDMPHPEASWRALFGPVVYEGEREAGFVYQSSSGSDEAELKYSLVPLIWGTLKATVVAMLFATPLAVLAAVYTSEFMHPRWRSAIKPGIEMMASVPSVVLGFIAAMLLAPLVRDLLPGVLVGLVVTPMVVLLAAEVWQALPAATTGRTGSRRLMLAAAGSVAAGVGASLWLGPVVEKGLFAPSRADVLAAARSVEPAPIPSWYEGRAEPTRDEVRRLRDAGLRVVDGVLVRPIEPVTPEASAAVQGAVDAGRLDRASVRRWLDGSIGGAWPGWFVVLVAPGVLVAGVGLRRVPVPTSVRALEFTRSSAGGVVSLVRFVVGATLALGIAAVGASLLTAAGLDTRDSIFGPFSQRNTLVVGIVMGFAVIPIIYSISEDALSTVPSSLRSASMGAGATRWQTARRVVLPVAASGVFSACMIGLGRAVGETMIVLMATGNTPEMTANIFAGFRTLAANIAVELPEAPKGSTHFRVLFLCGLVLFVMTFLINTTAEIVRLRFRKRSGAL